MKKAVVFDMDGVLLDTEKIYRMHWKKAGAVFGKSEREMDRVCRLIAGGTTDHSKQVFAEEFGEEFPYMECRELTYRMMEEYIADNGIELKPGVLEMLEHLKENRLKIAVATSTKQEFAEKRLKMTGIYDYFDQFVYSNMVSRGKPNPDIYLKACEMLKVAPEDAIGVEDSINGVKACHAAGLYTVMVIDLIKPDRDIFPYCDQIYGSMKEMLELI